MRISSNYIERFFFAWFPWLLGFTLLFYPVVRDISSIFIAVAILSTVYYLLERTHGRKHTLSKVIVQEDKLMIDGKFIDKNDIAMIRPYKTYPYTLFHIIELYLIDDTCIKFMDKPKTFLYKPNNNAYSKSLDILFKQIPALKKKLRAQKY